MRPSRHSRYEGKPAVLSWDVPVEKRRASFSKELAKHIAADMKAAGIDDHEKWGERLGESLANRSAYFESYPRAQAAAKKLRQIVDRLYKNGLVGVRRVEPPPEDRMAGIE